MAEKETTKETQAEAEVKPGEPSDFSALLEKEFKPKTDRVQEQVENAVRTLAEYVLKDVSVVSPDVVYTIEAIKTQIDEILTKQVSQILHSEEFQKVESAWRGLHHLVNNTETDDMLKIRVMNISKGDLLKTLKKFKGARWDMSPIFKKIYGE